MTAFAEIQARLGVTLPSTAKSFYQRPRKLANLRPPSLHNLVHLQLLYPAMPARFLPVFSISNGDMLGIYYPRGRDEVVVGFDHEESVLIPVSKDVRGLFQHPDAYCFNDPSDPRRCFWKRPGVFRPCRINPRSRIPELELLKPLDVHYRDLEGPDSDLFGPLVARFGSLDPRARLIREAFPKVLSLVERERWRKLAARFERSGFFREAIQVLENCHVLHFVHPHYGVPGRGDEDRIWSRVLEILEELNVLVRTHGDDLDRASLKRRIQLAREWSREE